MPAPPSRERHRGGGSPHARGEGAIDRFGPYELLEPLASGGMARVYRARMVGALGFEKIVAIKFMLPTFAADPQAVKMFVEEARLAATLSHANIVGILDFGRWGAAGPEQEYYIAMEYVSGANLRVLMKRSEETRRFPSITLAAWIAAEAARGLDYAHKKTDADGKQLFIVHRDVSPQNIVASWTGEVKILDFGIARSVGRSFETDAGTIKGKFAYMSPEQAAGLAVDHRSDVFSLGSVLYELLTHERAFPQPGHAALHKVRNGDLVPAERIRPDLPAPLLAILHRAMAHDVKDRYPSAAAMHDELSRWLAEERVRGGSEAHDGSSGALARWAEGLFRAAETDVPRPKTSTFLPGWGEDGAAPPEENPRPRLELTYSGSGDEDDLAAGDAAGEAAAGARAPQRTVASAPNPLFDDVDLSPDPPRAAAEAPTAQPPAAIAARPIAAFTPIARVRKPAPPPPLSPPLPDPSSADDAAGNELRSAPRTRTAIVYAGGAALGLLALSAAGLVTLRGSGTGTVTLPSPTQTAELARAASPAATPDDAAATATGTATGTTADALAVEAVPTANRVVDSRALIPDVEGTERVGLLNVSSTPPRAELFIDRTRIDFTPTVIPDLPAPHRYLVQMRKEGFAEWSREIDVSDDIAVLVVANLVEPEIPGKITLVIPKRATAYVDGINVGKGPRTITVEAQPGAHQVRVRGEDDVLIREYELGVTSGRVAQLEIPPIGR